MYFSGPWPFAWCEIIVSPSFPVQIFNFHQKITLGLPMLAQVMRSLSFSLLWGLLSEKKTVQWIEGN